VLACGRFWQSPFTRDGLSYLFAIISKAMIQTAWTTTAAAKRSFHAIPGGPSSRTGSGNRQNGLAAAARRSSRSGIGRVDGRGIMLYTI